MTSLSPGDLTLASSGDLLAAQRRSVFRLRSTTETRHGQVLFGRHGRQPASGQRQKQHRSRLMKLSIVDGQVKH